MKVEKFVARPMKTFRELWYTGACLLVCLVAWLPTSVPSEYRVRPVRVIAMSHGEALHEMRAASPERELSALAVQSTIQRYMKALLDQHYYLMWSLLHPQMQRKWPSEQAFEAFWQRRFHEYTLQGFTLGEVQYLPYWIDPETMLRYTLVQEVSISLHLSPKAPARYTTLLPEDQQPSQLFHNVPFIVQWYEDLHDGKGSWRVLNGGPGDLEAPILPPIAPVQRTLQVPILLYHHIMPFSPELASASIDYLSLWMLAPETFNAQMTYLEEHGYHTITFNQLFDALYYGGPLPPKPLLLTFDDADADHYLNAYPVLLAHHFSGMFYIPSGFVGRERRMTWPQLQEMLAHGMQIGSHTVRHVDFADLLNISEQMVQQELLQSQRDLQQHLGIVIQQFCYPYGDPFNRGVAWQQRRIVQLLAADSYIGSTTASGMIDSEQQSLNPHQLVRITMYGTESFDSFVAKLPWG